MEITKDTTCMGATAKQYRQSIQMWLANVEPTRFFKLLEMPQIVRAMKLQQKSRKKCLGERLKIADAQEGWPIRSITIEKEDVLLQTACNYQAHGISFEMSFAFTVSWNISMTSLLRHDNVDKVCYEDLRMSHDDGPHRNFSNVELRKIFGEIPVSPSMDNQMQAFCSKKTSEKNDVVGGHRHKQVDRCYVFSWWSLILYRVHECDMSNFNFYVDSNGKH